MESSVSALAMKRAFLAIYVLMPVGGFLLCLAFFGWSALMTDFQLEIAMLLYVVSVPIHEVLHYCGFVLFSGADRRDVEFRFNQKSMSPYVVCKVSTTVMRYKVAALLPFIFLGIPSLIYGLLQHDLTVLVVSLFIIMACSGDAILFFLLLRMDNHSLVVRHSQRIGFVVVKNGTNST